MGFCFPLLTSQPWAFSLRTIWPDWSVPFLQGTTSKELNTWPRSGKRWHNILTQYFVLCRKDWSQLYDLVKEALVKLKKIRCLQWAYPVLKSLLRSLCRVAKPMGWIPLLFLCCGWGIRDTRRTGWLQKRTCSWRHFGESSLVIFVLFIWVFFGG